MFKKANEVSRKNWWLRIPHPRQGLYTRNFNGRNYRFYRSWRQSWRPLYICWKLDSFRVLRPLGPRQGVCPSTPPVWGAWCALRHARCASAHGNFPPPPHFFWKSWIRHCYSMSGKLTQKCWGPKKRGSDSPPPRSSALGRRTDKKKCPPPPPPWSGSDWRPCRREPLICHKKNCQRRWRCGKKKFRSPPPLISFFGSCATMGWRRVRKKNIMSPPWSASDFRPCLRVTVSYLFFLFGLLYLFLHARCLFY